MTRLLMSQVLLAIASVTLVAQPAAAEFSGNGLSFLSGLLDDLGVDVDLPEIDVDLPPRAEEAIERAFDRAESVLDRVFGENPLGDGVLDGIDLPGSTPDVDQIVEDALARAREAASSAQERAQEAIEDALGSAESVLGDLDLPNLGGLPEVVQDALEGVDLPSLGDDVSDVVDGVLDDLLDDSDVGEVVEGALEEAADAVQDALGSLDGVTGVIDEILGSEDPLDAVLDSLPINQLPEPAQAVLESVFSGLVDRLPQQASVAVAVPEPGALSLLAMALAAGGVARRR